MLMRAFSPWRLYRATLSFSDLIASFRAARPGAAVRELTIDQILDLQSLILFEALMVLLISAVSDQDTILSARASLAKN